MVKRLCAVMLVAAMLMSVPATATGNIWGGGASDCGVWLERRKNDNDLQQAQWVMGFISSYNYYIGYKDDVDVFGDVSWQAVMAYIDKYCRENPLKTIPDAADAFISRDQ